MGCQCYRTIDGLKRRIPAFMVGIRGQEQAGPFLHDTVYHLVPAHLVPVKEIS